MSLIQDFSKQKCRVLAVLCGKIADRQTKVPKHQPKYPFPEISSSGRLEVQILSSPTPDKFGEAHKLFEPNILYFQGEQLEDEDEIGGLVWGTLDVSDPHMFSSLVAPSLSTTVYLEVPNGENIAQMLHSKGVPYVIYWKNAFSYRAASHFRQALLSVIQSSCSHTWDAFQLAHASFRLYCTRNNHVLPVNSLKVSGKVGPRLLGDSPKVDIAPLEKAPGEEENTSDSLPAVKIHDDDVDVRFLVCGEPCTLDACLLGSLEDGLGALLNIEIRGSKLHNRVSAAPPPLQAGSFSHGVVTMRCDLTTCSSAHVSLLVSGSAQTCFDDQLLECHIKNELIEKSQLVHALPSCEESKRPLLEPLNSICIACGASVFEVCMKVPTWAAQVLKHLAPETSYRSLVTLGIASVQGIPVASFEKEDAMRLLFFCKRREKDTSKNHSLLFAPPTWSSPVSRKRTRPGLETESGNCSNMVENGVAWPKFSLGHRLKVAAMRPIPHSRQHRILSFSRTPETDAYAGSQLKPIIPIAPPVKHNFAPHTPPTRRKSMSRTSHTQQIISLNPLPMKKHGCNRSPIRLCSEEEFLRDVMQFLILRGHSRLVPQGGISEFPDAILNTKRLDLYNLYREVVSRGGFYVGNGINWKGQVFSKMHNHTVTHRMTGVGNTLKRHYETYLLEYELAHDDVDGECCLLCHSSAPGDWVNCGLCGEWAHFGCDRRQGLGAFKDYAKTDGLEYICPPCSLKNYKRKSQKMVNGITHASTISRQV